jgi:DNA-binding GntR family transcriptional regulator
LGRGFHGIFVAINQIDDLKRYPSTEKETRATSALKTTSTVHERIYVQLKTMIAKGELCPGTPLELRPLAARLGVSKTPIIEAIRRLERDGLITVIPRLGAMVKQWTYEDVQEAYHIRRALESEAARLFVTRATPEDKAKLVQLNNTFDRLAASASLGSIEADINIHLHIVRCTRYPHLYQLVENSKIETTLQYGFRGMLSERALSYKKNAGVHESLIRALLGNDPDVAEHEMKRNLDNLLDMIRELERKNEEQGLAENSVDSYIR